MNLTKNKLGHTVSLQTSHKGRLFRSREFLRLLTQGDFGRMAWSWQVQGKFVLAVQRPRFLFDKSPDYRIKQAVAVTSRCCWNNRHSAKIWWTDLPGDFIHMFRSEMFWTILTSSPSKTFSPVSLQFLTCPTECVEIAAHSFQTSQILKRHAKLAVVHAIHGCLTKLSVHELKGSQTILMIIWNRQKVTNSDKAQLI